jgi:hypothetical protein
MARIPGGVLVVDFVIDPAAVARLRAYLNALESLAHALTYLAHGQVPCEGQHDSESCSLCKAKV